MEIKEREYDKGDLQMLTNCYMIVLKLMCEKNFEEMFMLLGSQMLILFRR